MKILIVWERKSDSFPSVQVPSAYLFMVMGHVPAEKKFNRGDNEKEDGRT